MTRAKIILLLSYICIASLSCVMITPALPQIKSFYGVSHGELEWIISIFLIGYVVGQLIYSPIANAYGRLSALRIGLTVNLVGVVVCLIASTWIPNFTLLLIGRLVTALGAASGLVCTFILINELLPVEQAKFVMAYAVLSFTIGVGLFITIGSLLTQYAQWYDCFWILLLHGLILLCCTYCFQEPQKKRMRLQFHSVFTGYIDAFSNPTLLIFAALCGFVSIFSYCYSAVASIYAQHDLQLSPSHYGYWSLFNTAGMLISGFMSAAMIKRFGIKNTLYFGIVFFIPCLLSLWILVLGHYDHTLWFFITTMFLFIGTGHLFPVGAYYASNAIADRANASAAMSFINMGLGALSVIILGYLPFSSIMSFVMMISISFIIVTSLIFLKK